MENIRFRVKSEKKNFPQNDSVPITGNEELILITYYSNENWNRLMMKKRPNIIHLCS